MEGVEDGGQQVTLAPWPHPEVHPVRLERAAAAGQSYADYVASLDEDDAEDGGHACLTMICTHDISTHMPSPDGVSRWHPQIVSSYCPGKAQRMT